MRRGILATREELSALREKITRRPFARIYNMLHERCGLILESSPISEGNWRAVWGQGSHTAAVLAARTTQGRILDLLIAHHVEPNTAFRDRAVEELKNLISWTTWVDPCHADLSADLCTAEAATAAVIALDWLWEDLSRPDRLRVLQAVRKKAVIPYRLAVQNRDWWYTCYHTWNAVVNSGCGLACLALSDEDPRAEEAYNLARKGLNNFFDALGTEGGWDEGVGHWGYAMRYVLLLGEAAWRLQDDQRILHKRGMDGTGKFPVYFTPNGHAASFGDSTAVPLYGTFYLLVKHFGTREVLWWLDNYAFHRDVSTTGWSAAGLALLFKPADSPAVTDARLKPVKIFNEIGWAAAADRWPKPTLYVAARAGDLSAHNLRRDMNSIQVQIGGEMLLRAPLYPPNPGLRPRGGTGAEHSAMAPGDLDHVQAGDHNTIVVAERDHRIDARGSIVEAQTGKNFRWIACDAHTACGQNVRFIRHVIMIVQPQDQTGKMLIVLDELTDTIGERIDQFWHTHGRLQMKARSKSGIISGRRAELHFALASTVRTKVSTESHGLDRNETDTVICVTAGNATSAMFASVFAPMKITGKVAFGRGAAAGVVLQVGSTAIQFKRRKNHLQLDKITQK